MKSPSRYLLFSLLIAMIGVSCAQSRLNSGKTAYEAYRFTDAISQFEKGLVKKNDPEARLMLADSYLRLKQYNKAQSTYELASLDPSVTDKDRIKYGQALMSNRMYDEALDVFDGILSRDSNNKVAQELASSCRQANNMMRDSALYEVDLVSLPIAGPVYSPVWTGDGLMVTSNAASGVRDPYTNQGYSDLQFVKIDNGSWSKTDQLNSINSRYHDAAGAMSSDGNQMIFTHSNLKNGNRTLQEDAEHMNNMQLFASSKTAEGTWSEPERLPFNEDSYMYAHPALSADGNTLIFSSDRQGGFGGMDLYAVERMETGWTQPVNLGPSVNTPRDELFPTLLGADTLYFSSNAHATLGGLDLHYSVKTGSQWGTPVHLTYPMNTSADDFGMTFISADEGYLSSDRSGTDAVYHFLHTEPDLVLSGMVSNKSSMLPIEGVQVTVRNETDGTEEVISSGSDGRFSTKLETGKDYEVIAEDGDYFNVSEKVSTIGKTTDEDIPIVIEMERLVVTNPDGAGSGDGTGNGSADGGGDGSGDGSGDGDGTSGGDSGGDGAEDGTDDGHNPSGVGNYPIPNIYWDYNSWEVKTESEPYLDQLVKTLKDNPGLTVQIRSHCDCRGSNGFNDKLSKKRAQAVTEYLISKGISRSKLQSRGMGKRKLVNDCDCKTKTDCSEFQHSKNRRTEFIVVDK